MNPAAELRRNPVSKRHIQSEYGDEQADAGRDCRTRLARPNSQARTRTGKGKYPFSLSSSGHEQDWQPYPVDPYSCYMCDHIYTTKYIITVGISIDLVGAFCRCSSDIYLSS